MFSPAIADSDEGSNSGVIYNSIITPLPGNLPSQAFEAWQVSEFGNAVNFSSGKGFELNKVIVTMSSWGCESRSLNANTCLTSEKASFTHPITLNVYNPSIDGVNPGIRIATVTKTFAIKFRPSASSECTGTNLGKWYDKSSKTCFNGFAQNITFDLKNIKVGSGAIFGVAYNTSHYGYSPIGQGAACYSTSAGCGYDSLNVALSADPTDVTRGSSVVAGKLWGASLNKDFYADGGAAGLGTFRMDSPNVPAWWGVNEPWTSAPWYVPSIKVFGNQSNKDDEKENKKEDKKSDDKSSGGKGTESKSDGKPGVKKD
jgi:hypothetical protein